MLVLLNINHTDSSGYKAVCLGPTCLEEKFKKRHLECMLEIEKRYVVSEKNIGFYFFKLTPPTRAALQISASELPLVGETM